MMNHFSNVNEQKSFANSPLICCFQLLNGSCISYCFKKKRIYVMFFWPLEIMIFFTRPQRIEIFQSRYKKSTAKSVIFIFTLDICTYGVLFIRFAIIGSHWVSNESIDKLAVCWAFDQSIDCFFRSKSNFERNYSSLWQILMLLKLFVRISIEWLKIVVLRSKDLLWIKKR